MDYREVLNSAGSRTAFEKYDYDLNNRLTRKVSTTTNANQNIINYAYDRNGNMTARAASTMHPSNDGTAGISMTAGISEGVELFTYDGFNRLVGFEKGGENPVTASYTHNGSGLRQSKTVSYMDGTEHVTETTNFIYDGRNIVSTTESSGEHFYKNTYIRGFGIINSGAWYYSTNHRGDIISKTLQGGFTFNLTSYDPYGRPASKTLTTNFGYNGEWRDWETGFVYLRARFYDPGMGRFINEDPHWKTHNMIYGDEPEDCPNNKLNNFNNNPVPNLNQDVSEIIKKQQALQKQIDEIFLMQGITSDEKIMLATRVRLGQLTDEDKQLLGDEVSGVRTPDILAIMQSSNLYVYGLNNPLKYDDPTGLKIPGKKLLTKAGLRGLARTLNSSAVLRVAETFGAAGTLQKYSSQISNLLNQIAKWEHITGQAVQDQTVGMLMSMGVSREAATKVGLFLYNVVKWGI